MTRTVLVGLLLAVLAALLLRCPQLDSRPMHNDEAVNAIKLRALWQQNSYRYDPREYHGPTLIYAALGWVKSIHAPNFVQLTESQLRLVPVIFGVALILILPLMADGLGGRATAIATLLTAISPAMVFYSRYFIHEMLLVFFTLLALAAGWRYERSRKVVWALLAGVAVGLMHATKETFVLSLAAMIAAWIINEKWSRALEPLTLRFKLSHLVTALAAWAVVAITLFSSFFTNAQGPLDSLRTYLPWLHRAAGASPHIHPWNFYLERLAWFHDRRGPVWSEGLILTLALVGGIASFFPKKLSDGRPYFIRFVALYTVFLTAIYCVIGYKTPWCLLNFLVGMILLAGVGAVAVLDWMPNRPAKFIVTLGLLTAAGQLAFQAWRAAIPYAADPRNPYVYAQTSDDLLNLVDRVQALAKVSPQKNNLVIKVIAPDSDYWPLPWYLRQFPNVGWWSEMPANPYAPVMIVSTQLQANLDAKGTFIMAGLTQLRPQTFFECYVESGLWQAHVAAARPAP